MERFTKVEAGYQHFVLLKSDGSVWCLGDNTYGQLGNYSDVASDVLVQSEDLAGVVGVAAGYNFSLALKSDGTVWAWGDGALGQLGDAESTGSLVPVQVPGLAGIIEISAGFYYGVALKSDGTVYTWGYNEYGAMGRGAINETSAAPAAIPGLADVQHISAGGHSTLFRKANGEWHACGKGYFADRSEPDYPGSETRETPSICAAFVGSPYVKAGRPWLSSYINAAGVVMTEGAEGPSDSFGDGVLGDDVPAGYAAHRFGTSALGTPSCITRDDDACFVVFDGRLYAAGSDEYGQMASGGTSATPQSVPKLIPLPGRVKAVANTEYDGVVAVTEGGFVYRWGDHGLAEPITSPQLLYSPEQGASHPFALELYKTETGLPICTLHDFASLSYSRTQNEAGRLSITFPAGHPANKTIRDAYTAEPHGIYGTLYRRGVAWAGVTLAETDTTASPVAWSFLTFEALLREREE